MKDLNLQRMTRTQLIEELERLQHRELLLDATEKIAHIGHTEWDYEHDRMKSCSEEYARFFNMSVEEVKESRDSWQKVIQQIHPDDREHFSGNYRAMGSTGSHEVEYRIVLDNGEIRHIREIGVMVDGDDGKQRDTFGLLQDISSLKKYEIEFENRDALVQHVEALADAGHFVQEAGEPTMSALTRGASL